MTNIQGDDSMVGAMLRLLAEQVAQYEIMREFIQETAYGPWPDSDVASLNEYLTTRARTIMNQSPPSPNEQETVQRLFMEFVAETDPMSDQDRATLYRKLVTAYRIGFGQSPKLPEKTLDK